MIRTWFYRRKLAHIIWAPPTGQALAFGRVSVPCLDGFATSLLSAGER